MESKQKDDFKKLCVEYLHQWGIMDLRSYGRSLGLPAPTKLKKAELIEEIIEVLCEERGAVRTKRGAPIKNKRIEEEIPSESTKYVRIFLARKRRKLTKAKTQKGKKVLRRCNFPST